MYLKLESYRRNGHEIATLRDKSWYYIRFLPWGIEKCEGVGDSYSMKCNYGLVDIKKEE